ncbi:MULTISPECIES: hypothetical protein [unclassified Granulicatella]|uniref:hypothetical protein n=1 Tax=unclassified Granulicatella TaxID=2630493 RepID=UPI0010744C7E|nr:MULTISPECIES: hypothetical protein [unclassified Granulicatella]MBF0779800.1 hypothetical protein [Granulicatella sp. 19428wC4_WM01]TFU96202.1 hypothetical protein E4T68_01710 [Granulicatella sp. WM01]
MLSTTRDYINTTLASNRQFQARVMMNDIEYTSDVIFKISYDSSIADGDKFVVGGGFTNTVSVELLQIVEGLVEHTPIKVYISLLVNNTYVELPLGQFYATEIVIDRNANKTTVKAGDGMIFTEKKYISNLNYPVKAKEVLEEITQYLGVELAPLSSFSDDIISDKQRDITCREALIYLAQINGAFLRFDRYGRLSIDKLNNTTRKISKDNYFLKGLTKNEIDFRLKGITNTITDDNNKTITMQSGSEKGVQMELKNPWINQTILDRLYNEYRRLNYYPFDLNWQGDVSLESIDWVTLEHSEDEWISVPLLSYSLIFNGGLSSKATARASTQSQSPYIQKGFVTKKIELLETMMSGINQMYLDQEDPIEPNNGDKWFKPNGTNVELYERIDGYWVKKADTSDLNEIVNSFSKDEVIAKKLYGALASFIEINANKIVAGDIDLQRLRIVDGSKEVLTIRDGRLVANLGEDVPKKVDLDHLSSVQNATYTNFRTEILKELEAKAAIIDLRAWQQQYLKLQETNRQDIAQALSDLIASTERINGIDAKLGALAVSMAFIDRFVKISNEGIIIGNIENDSYIQINDSRITMFSGGSEVMYLSQGVLHIKRGVFVNSVQIGKYVWMQYEINPDMMVLRYVGGL